MHTTVVLLCTAACCAGMQCTGFMCMCLTNMSSVGQQSCVAHCCPRRCRASAGGGMHCLREFHVMLAHLAAAAVTHVRWCSSLHGRGFPPCLLAICICHVWLAGLVVDRHAGFGCCSMPPSFGCCGCRPVGRALQVKGRCVAALHWRCTTACGGRQQSWHGASAASMMSSRHCCCVPFLPCCSVFC